MRQPWRCREGPSKRAHEIDDPSPAMVQRERAGAEALADRCDRIALTSASLRSPRPATYGNRREVQPPPCDMVRDNRALLLPVLLLLALLALLSLLTLLSLLAALLLRLARALVLVAHLSATLALLVLAALLVTLAGLHLLLLLLARLGRIPLLLLSHCCLHDTRRGCRT